MLTPRMEVMQRFKIFPWKRVKMMQGVRSCFGPVYSISFSICRDPTWTLEQILTWVWLLCAKVAKIIKIIHFPRQAENPWIASPLAPPSAYKSSPINPHQFLPLLFNLPFAPPLFPTQHLMGYAAITFSLVLAFTHP